MHPKNTSQPQVDTSTKNQIVGYANATGNAAEAGCKENINCTMHLQTFQSNQFHHKEMRLCPSNKAEWSRPVKLYEMPEKADK